MTKGAFGGKPEFKALKHINLQKKKGKPIGIETIIVKLTGNLKYNLLYRKPKGGMFS